MSLRSLLAASGASLPRNFAGTVLGNNCPGPNSVCHPSLLVVIVGIGIVLLIWAVVGTLLAGLGALFLGGATALLTREVQKGRRSVILCASVFPFLCLAWAGIVFVFQAAVNDFVFHRDAGLGDTWKCPLPDGYALLMIDETDQGWVYNPKTQGWGGVGERDDSLSGVRVLQLSGPYIFGGLDSHAYQFASKDDHIESYFLLDTKTGKHQSFPTYEALQGKAQQLGATLNLERISVVYSRYRYSWFEKLVAFVFCAPPLLFALLLIWWIVRLRKARGMRRKAGD